MKKKKIILTSPKENYDNIIKIIKTPKKVYGLTQKINQPHQKNRYELTRKT